MQVSITSLVGFNVPLTIIDGNGRRAPYGLAPYASAVVLTMPDDQLQAIVGLRSTGKITYTYVTFPTIATDFNGGVVGRTIVPGATYTTVQADLGNVIDLESATAGTITLAANLPRGFSCGFLQAGAGAYTFAVGAGGTMHLPGATTKTNGQWTQAAAFVRDNQGGNAAEWVVSGNLA